MKTNKNQSTEAISFCFLFLLLIFANIFPFCNPTKWKLNFEWHKVDKEPVVGLVFMNDPHFEIILSNVEIKINLTVLEINTQFG